MEEERLQKYLARAGVASRRACEQLIETGRIKVNGTVVKELGTRVVPNRDRVEFDGREVVADVRHVYLMVHKPQGMISSAVDPEGRPVVTSLIPEDFGRIYPVGRLDWDSEGLLILTDDGRLTQLLTHPRHEVPKTYHVKVRGRYAPDDARIERIRHGTRLDDGTRTRPCDVVLDAETAGNTWYVVTISEGKNRQVRRMFESVGILVSRLRRIAMGPLLLGDLAPSDFRRLTDTEIEELYKAAGGKRPHLSASRGRLPHSNRDGKLAMQRAARKATGPRVQRAEAPPEAPAPATAAGERKGRGPHKPGSASAARTPRDPKPAAARGPERPRTASGSRRGRGK